MADGMKAHLGLHAPAVGEHCGSTKALGGSKQKNGEKKGKRKQE